MQSTSWIKLGCKVTNSMIVHLPPLFFLREILLRIIIIAVVIIWLIASSLVKTGTFIPIPIFVGVPLLHFGIKSLAVSLLIFVIIVTMRFEVEARPHIPPLVLSWINSETAVPRSSVIACFFFCGHLSFFPHFFIAWDRPKIMMPRRVIDIMIMLEGVYVSPPFPSGVRIIIGVIALVVIVSRLVIMIIFIPHLCLWMAFAVLRHFYNPVIVDKGRISLASLLRHSNRSGYSFSIHVHAVFMRLFVFLPLQNVEGCIDLSKVPACHLSFVRRSIGGHNHIRVVKLYHSFVCSPNGIKASPWVEAQKYQWVICIWQWGRRLSAALILGCWLLT
mmetsp:Transcript_11339/g.20855  ORF Transcript_11339/g.20855 Transcript_11339/m.20855 type:complete len:332 (-) Transcript_11339:310-1305(-)